MSDKKPSWCGCDGHGNERPAAPLAAPLAAPETSRGLTRRRALSGASLAAVAWMSRGASALAEVAVAPQQSEIEHDVLVLADFRLAASGKTTRDRELQHALAEFYSDGRDAVAQAGRETLAVLQTLNRLDPAHYRPAHGAAYPDSELGNGLRQVACLIKGKVGLEVACLDHRGPYLWDTHIAQNNLLTAQVDDVGRCVAAFAADMGAGMKRVLVAVMTEFGRRLQENSGLGTDHGRGGVMLLLGEGVAGGRVFARWPGLEDHQLEPPGDLRVTTDYRDVLAEIVAKRLHNPHLDAVFPNYTPRFPGLVRAAA